MTQNLVVVCSSVVGSNGGGSGGSVLAAGVHVDRVCCRGCAMCPLNVSLEVGQCLATRE